MARVKQLIRYKATHKNKKSKYKKKYFIRQTVTTKNNKQQTKYSYGKKIYISKSNKYLYKR